MVQLKMCVIKFSYDKARILFVFLCPCRIFVLSSQWIDEGMFKSFGPRNQHETVPTAQKKKSMEW